MDHANFHNQYGVTDTAEACQLICQKYRLCEWFNWNKNGRKDCFLKTGKGTEKWVLGAATGQRNCPGKYNRQCPQGGGRVMGQCQHAYKAAPPA